MTRVPQKQPLRATFSKLPSYRVMWWKRHTLPFMLDTLAMAASSTLLIVPGADVH